MKCIILAGGFGTRLYPLTENFPKALIEIGNKTIIDRIVDELVSLRKIDEYVVVSNHRYYSTMLGWALDRKENITVIDDGAISNESRYGAVKAVQLAIDKCGIDDDCIICGSDIIFDFSLISFLGYCQRKGTSCLMRYYEENDIRLRKSTVASVNVNDKIIKMTNKPAEPESYWVCPHFAYVVKGDLPIIKDAINDGVDIDALGDLVAYIANHSVVHALEMPGKMFRITNDSSLKKARKDYKAFG